MTVWFDHDFVSLGSTSVKRELLFEQASPGNIAVRPATDEDRETYRAEYAAYLNPPQSAAERIAALEAENAALRERPQSTDERIAELEAENAALKERLDGPMVEPKPQPASESTENAR